jgi:hypothetical protein
MIFVAGAEPRFSNEFIAAEKIGVCSLSTMRIRAGPLPAPPSQWLMTSRERPVRELAASRAVGGALGSNRSIPSEPRITP